MNKFEFDKFVLILLISYITISDLKSFISKSDKNRSQSSFIERSSRKYIQQNDSIDHNVNKLITNNKIDIQFPSLDINVENLFFNKKANNNQILNIYQNKSSNDNRFDFYDKMKLLINHKLSKSKTDYKSDFGKNTEIKSRLSKSQQRIIKNYLVENYNFFIRCANKQECVIDIPFIGEYGIFDIIDKGIRNRKLKNFIIQLANKKGIYEFFGITLDDFFSILDQTYKKYGYNPVTCFAKNIKSCSKREYIYHVDDFINKLSI